MDRLPTSASERVGATGRVLLGFGRAGVQRLVRRSTDDDRALGELLVGELDRMKGLAMKVGQILSYMEVGLPEETAAVLARLQRGGEPLSGERVIAVLEAELGAQVDVLFERFDREPVASASIGQVHRASFRGREVAVKVRYPEVRETLEADTRQIGAIARVASMATSVDGPALVAELRERILEECDYAHEAESQRRFSRLLADDPVLVVPEVIAERSGAGVLTTVWWDGAPLSSVKELDDADRSVVIGGLARLAWGMLLGHGLLHADPHPGNFLVAPGPRLVVLDYGCVKELAPDRVALLRGLLGCVVEGRRGEVMTHATALGLVPEHGRVDPDELWELLDFLGAPYRGTFTFDRTWWETSMKRWKRPDTSLRHLGMPPDWMWVQRTLVGLHAVLVGLGATADLGPIARAALSTPPTSQ
ncbi:MAG: AarF/ABC1/UbiB kinase family protein [Alphaproteobacteria bacterium]|nr:AarF/ABC1/UbiB kinase family protein [Alphaproteobacteria bacterium]MCB9695238.1 AarF/ABC1/UbiB kinase family protein [Alphaproteobacteria bacterium]